MVVFTWCSICVQHIISMHAKTANGTLSKFHSCANLHPWTVNLSSHNIFFRPVLWRHILQYMSLRIYMWAYCKERIVYYERFVIMPNWMYRTSSATVSSHWRLIRNVWFRNWLCWVFKQEPSEQIILNLPQTLHCKLSNNKYFWRSAFSHLAENLKTLLCLLTYIV